MTRLDNLKNKEYRDAFVESHIENGIAFQIKTMRESRNLTQKQLGDLANMKPVDIYKLEDPNYGGYFTLKTLEKIAATFDVALIVKFVPFSELVQWDRDLSEKTLNVVSFDEELALAKITTRGGKNDKDQKKRNCGY